jgi:hypothetical protein
MKRFNFDDPKLRITFLIGFILIAALLSSFISSPSSSEKNLPSNDDLTTYIPKGYRLVPINVENYKNLDQILGNYGIVDIYLRKYKGDKVESLQIASAVRAVRGTETSEAIGLILPKEEVKRILNFSGPFYLSLSNEKQEGTLFVKSEPSKLTKRVKFSN